MVLSFEDRLAIIEASGYFFQQSPPEERQAAVLLNSLVLRITTTPSGGLSASEAEIVRECLAIFVQAFPDDSAPQQSLLARLPHAAPYM